MYLKQLIGKDDSASYMFVLLEVEAVAMVLYISRDHQKPSLSLPFIYFKQPTEAQFCLSHSTVLIWNKMLDICICRALFSTRCIFLETNQKAQL